MLVDNEQGDIAVMLVGQGAQLQAQALLQVAGADAGRVEVLDMAEGDFQLTGTAANLLLQLLAWYFILTDLLPAADAALRLGPGVYLSKSGLALPWWGEQGFEPPEIAGFGIEGGARLTPEYLAMLLGLVLYSAAYIAETLRAAVEALPPGQRLAALAMGMTPRQAFLLVLLPQAWRAALPPVTSQLLNLFKNASLAVAIGYPDLVSVAGTSLNQTGRAIECLSIVIAVYLLLSLAAAALSHRLEARSLRGTPR